MKKKKGFWPRLKKIVLYNLLIIFIFFSGIALLNLNLPSTSPFLDRLSPNEQSRIVEINHLQETIGDQVWPDWSSHKTPILLYNEDYVFLTGIDNPDSGWVRVPYNKLHGSSWEKIDDQITYYRQPLPDNGETPQAFVVKIGESFAASMTTKDWTKIRLVKMIKSDIPGFLKPIVPYSLIINRLNSDWHISGILHESFHAFQASKNYQRLEEAEKANSLHNSYPWENPNFRQSWVQERHLLAQAIQEENNDKAKLLVNEWLNVRKSRRNALSEELIDYEKKREWLEGLAKYVELKSWRIAADSSKYIPINPMKNDSDFNFYQNASSHFEQELDQLQSDLGFSESMFYYSGWAQAELLDRFYPNWKDLALQPDVYLEDLLREQCIPLNCGITQK